MHPSHIMTQREIIRNNLNKSDWEITKDKCDSTRAHRRHLAANGKHENKRKIYCTNVHLRIIEILITLMYKLSAVTAAVTESLTLEENFATTQKRGLIFVRTVDGKYCLQVAPKLDASFDELANVHPPEIPNTVLMIAPPHTSFREANYAAALFGSFSEVKHYQSGPRIHYEFVYDNRESAIIADNSIVDSLSTKYYDADPDIRANIIATHSKGKQKSDQILFTIGTVFGASKQLEKFQKDPPLKMRYD